MIAPAAGLRQFDNLRSYEIGSSISFARELAICANRLEGPVHVTAEIVGDKLNVGEFAHSSLLVRAA